MLDQVRRHVGSREALLGQRRLAIHLGRREGCEQHQARLVHDWIRVREQTTEAHHPARLAQREAQLFDALARLGGLEVLGDRYDRRGEGLIVVRGEQRLARSTFEPASAFGPAHESTIVYLTPMSSRFAVCYGR